MSFFPILLDFDGLPCLVAGGGRLGLHKAKLLLENGYQIFYGNILAEEFSVFVMKVVHGVKK